MHKLFYFYLKLKGYFLKNLSVFLLIFVFLLFFLRAFVFLDPDFGWRIKSGELFLSSGISKTDPFSYTIPSFPWVDHAWLQSIIMSFIFRTYGKSILCLIYTVIVLATLIISLRRNKKRENDRLSQITNNFTGLDLGAFGNISFILLTYVVWYFFGIRAQVVSWLMIALTLNLLLDIDKWFFWRKFFPLLFFVWVNLHGSFFLGLCVVTTVLVIRCMRLKKFDLTDFLILTFCLLLTFVNPYGPGVWREVWSSVSDAGLRWSVVEWMPALTMPNLPVAFFIAFSLILIIKQKENFKIEEFTLYFAFLLAAILSRRHLPLWAVVTFPLVNRAIYHFYNKISKIKGGIFRFKKVYRIAWIGVCCLLLIQVMLDFKEILFLREGGYYPKQAVSYLKQNLPAGRIFSEYGWGGYLIWKLPEKKVFIDGRMPSWRWDPPNEFEESSTFDVYSNVIKGEEDYKAVFDKYKIDTVLWTTRGRKGFWEVVSEKVSKLSGRETAFDFCERLEKDGWERLYEDSVATIYQKRN